MSVVQSDPAMKVSYCITCKGRLHHLQRTLPLNLAAEKDNPDVEFVVLDYQSEDGLAEWVRDTYAEEIARGRIVHAYHAPAPHFKMAHAKNIAHRVASGGILCNLDADNMLPPGNAAWLQAQFARRRTITVSSRRMALYGYAEARIVAPLLGLPRPLAGTAGRIAVSRENFYRLTGYDETFSAWGGDDIDFQARGRQAGLQPIRIPRAMWGSVVVHGADERVGNLSEEDRKTALGSLQAHVLKGAFVDLGRKLRRYDIAPNKDGRFGMGQVDINFGQEVRRLEAVAPIDQSRFAADAGAQAGTARSLPALGN